ncbi:30S ribosomal protein s1 [Mycoplasmopsis maculosa]|uniref:30S ribosomal protein s1 n=1 Tax=Mycoplasmopsis maculosa TaxID=114885 RepID=A0A449B3U4_9BACT|nr:S1 RNA-binding domain-containing protein [Mycoplasmopsis maculosa]VEU75274.1 30S ribosomal protein s1 [Mycoplasmopsis maculosa]
MIKKGDILYGLVKSISEHGIVVKTFNNIRFFIPVSLITDFKRNNINSFFEEGQKINFIVENIDQDQQSGIGNFKLNHPLYFRAPYKNNIKETKNGFNNLKKEIDEFIKNYQGE